jgi:outer membrane protein assembly factor BamB
MMGRSIEVVVAAEFFGTTTSILRRRHFTARASCFFAQCFGRFAGNLIWFPCGVLIIGEAGLKKHLHAQLAVLSVLLWLAFFLPFAFAAVNDSASPDWPMFRHDPDHTGYTTTAGPTTPNVLWSFSTRGNPVTSSPAVADGRLYVGSENGNIYCLDAKTGRQIWLNFKIDSATRSTPAISNGFLYICDSNDLFYCIDAQTGEINWTFSMGAWSYSSPTVANGYVYFSSSSRKLYCLDAFTGQEMWDFNLTSLEPSIPGTDWTTPYSASGSTSPAVVDDRVYVGGTNLYCLDAGSGTLIWSYPIIVANAPAVSEGKVYFSSWQRDLYCLDADTGEKVWNQSNIGGLSGSGPSVANGRVYFGGLIYCLSASNGEEIWRYSTGDISADSSPIVAGEYAYFGTSHGGYENICTYCVKAATGEYVWKSAPPFSSSPAVVDGVLYVSGGDSIVAFSDSLRIPAPGLIIAFTVAAICAVVVLAYVANREGAEPQTKLKKVFTVPVTLSLIVIIIVSSLAFIYITGFAPSNEWPFAPSNGRPSSPRFSPASSLLWQTDIEHFSSGITAGDRKVFIITAGAAYAYDARDGQHIWTSSIGERWGIEVYAGSVYVGVGRSSAGLSDVRSPAVYRLNETSGKIIRAFQAPIHSSIMSKYPPGFTLGDGKIFVVSDGLSVYNVDSGGLYWQINDFSWYPHESIDGTPAVTLGELGTPEINRLGYVYIFRNSRVTPPSRLDVNNGKQLWDAGGWSDGDLVVDDRVVFWNFVNGAEQPNRIHCVDALVGSTLWDFDPGVPVYEPVVYGGLLVFGASDGYLYALNLADGSLAWKILVDVDGWMGGHNLPADAKSLSVSASSIVVDYETGVGVWGFLVTERQIEGVNGDNLYVGVLCSFDVSNGTVLRTYRFQSSCDLSDNGLGLAPGRDVFYLTAGLDVWSVDKATGKAAMLQRYEHYVQKPVLYDGTIYIAADLYLSAYR